MERQSSYSTSRSLSPSPSPASVTSTSVNRGLLDLSPSVPSVTMTTSSPSSRLWSLVTSPSPDTADTPSATSTSCPQTALAVALHRVYAAKLQSKDQTLQSLQKQNEDLEAQLSAILESQRHRSVEDSSQRRIRQCTVNEIEKLATLTSQATPDVRKWVADIKNSVANLKEVVQDSAAVLPSSFVGSGSSGEGSDQAKSILRCFLAEPIQNLQSSFQKFAMATKADLQSTGEMFSASQAQLAALRSSMEDKLAALTSKYDVERQRRRRILNELIELKGNIRVFVRIRPPHEDSAVALSSLSENSLCLKPSPERPTQQYEFDRVFGPSTTQKQVFDEVSPLVHSCLDGYNACIFAYGQTGSGKTHTMEGPIDDPGVNFRALHELFAVIDERRDTNITYNVSVSILEIYNESINDLLRRDISSQKLNIRLGQNGLFHVPGLTKNEVHSAEDVRALCDQATSLRATFSTSLNEHSSRSHALVLVYVDSVNSDTLDRTHSLLALIDLAGSERVSRSEAQGSRLREAQAINRSLSALGDVMAALRSKAGHVPFRNSKLTHLLQDCLCGSGKTLMMCQISPDDVDATESTCSLQFAQRVSEVELGVSKKTVVGGELARYKVLLQKARDELEARTARMKEQDQRLSALREEEQSQKDKALQARRKVVSLESANRDLREQLALAQREQVKLKRQLRLQVANSSQQEDTENASVPGEVRPPLTTLAANKSFMQATSTNAIKRRPVTTPAALRDTPSEQRKVRFASTPADTVPPPGTARRTRIKSVFDSASSSASNGSAARVRKKPASGSRWRKY